MLAGESSVPVQIYDDVSRGFKYPLHCGMFATKAQV